MHLVRGARGAWVLDCEVASDHRGGFTAPIESSGDRLAVETSVTRAVAGATVAVERQDAAGEGVVDQVQSTHRVDPTSHRGWPIVDLVDHIHVKPWASFLVVLVTRHEPTLRRIHGSCGGFGTTSADPECGLAREGGSGPRRHPRPPVCGRQAGLATSPVFEGPRRRLHPERPTLKIESGCRRKSAHRSSTAAFISP
jgi:hypothetical protein